jgi:hypothetical protein
MTQPVAVLVAKIVAIVAVVNVIAFFGHVPALFGFVPLFGSLAAAVFLTRREQRRLGAATGPGLVFATWTGAWFLIALIAVGRSSREVVEMSWMGAVTGPVVGEAEVRLEARDNERWRMIIISSQLHRYLAERGRPTVPVTFEVDRHFGCAGAFRVVRIGELDSWNEITSQIDYGHGAVDPWPKCLLVP